MEIVVECDDGEDIRDFEYILEDAPQFDTSLEKFKVEVVKVEEII
jgi:hypothetical protein